MPRRRPRISRAVLIVGGVLLLAAVVVAVVALAGSGSSGGASGRQMESIFQDDQMLLYEPTPTVARTLDLLHRMGVDRVRVTVLWAAVAPGAASTRRPAHFRATDPDAYPAAGWAPYDRVVELAGARGIAVDFNVTAPGPLWAMVHPAPSAKVATHYRPSPKEFGSFVEAIGRRYSGHWTVRGANGTATIPRVSFWTIWNEPNQPGWLAPQWRAVGRRRVVDSPRLYRVYVDAAYAALAATSHTPSSDTILIGELAPEGTEGSKDENPLPPLPFLRALYCVGPDYKPLRGALVGLLHCPSGGSPAEFVKANPGLFEASGFAHHPYAFFLAPNVSMSDANFAPLADMGRLEHALDAIFASYGVHRSLPIYVTEYGYETNPPDPFRGVSLADQAAYLNEAEYLAWKDPRVRSMAQFLLLDSAPNPRFKRGTIGYWDTFQTGLMFSNGKAKPSFRAYRLPIFIAQPRFRSGSDVLVWGMLRAAPNSTTQHAQLQWSPPHGQFRTIATVTVTNPNGFFTADVRLPGSGSVQIAWQSPQGRIWRSRAAAVTMAG
jgi:hypothetical protein